MQYRTIHGLQTREEGTTPIISGYFAVFDTETELYKDVYEKIDKNAFDGELNADVRALINHDTTLVTGRTTAGTLALRTDDKGLWGDIKINPEDTDAMNAWHRVQRGDVTQCSFGFDIVDEEKEYRADGSVLFIIRKIKLYEVSICTFPAYEDTAIQARKKQIEADKKRMNEAWKLKTKERLKNGIKKADA